MELKNIDLEINFIENIVTNDNSILRCSLKNILK